MSGTQPTLWSEAERVFQLCLTLPEDQRSSYLETQLDSDSEIRKIVEDLLRLHTYSLSLNQPAGIEGVIGFGEDFSASEWVGQRLGNYRIVRLLGQGGMGAVFLAERDDQHFNKLVAIKLIKAANLRKPYAERFLAERQILASLDHPYIATLLDGGSAEQGMPYLVMEYFNGIPINEYCEQNRLTLEQRLGLFCKVAQAVSFAHKNLIVHQDIKPGNILVDPEGLPKLLDFGIARLMENSADSEDGSGIHFLTPSYASPEQIEKQPVNTTSDIYSLGVLLFEMLTGDLPRDFSNNSLREISQIFRTDQAIKPSDFLALNNRQNPVKPSALKRDLDHIVMRAMHIDPEQRYQSVFELLQDIGRHQRYEPVQATPGGRMYRIGRFCKRHSVATVSGALLSLSLLIITALSIVQSDHVALERDRAETITEYLVDAFVSADPRVSSGTTVTAQQILQRSTQHLSELTDQPELSFMLLRVLVRVYYGLGEFKIAGELGKRMVDIAADTRDISDAETHSANLQFAEVLLELKEYDDALIESGRAINYFRKQKASKDIAQALLVQGEGFYRTGQIAAAQVSLEQALSIYTDLFGKSHVGIATTLVKLALVERYSGSLTKGLEQLQRALDIYQELLPPDHFRISEALHALAQFSRDAGQLEAAADYASQALLSYTKTLGESHIKVAYTLNTLGSIQQKEGMLTAAIESFEKSLAIKRLNLQLGGSGTLYATQLNLGELYYQAGNWDEALQYLNQAFEQRQPQVNWNHPDLLYLHRLLGAVTLNLNMVNKAEPHLHRALAIAEQIEPYNGLERDVSEVQSDLSEVLRLQERFMEALALHQESFHKLLKYKELNQFRLKRMKKNEAALMQKATQPRI